MSEEKKKADSNKTHSTTSLHNSWRPPMHLFAYISSEQQLTRLVNRDEMSRYLE